MTTEQIIAEARRVLEHPCSSDEAKARMAELIDLLSVGAAPTADEAAALLQGIGRLYATAELVRWIFDHTPPGEVQ